MRKTILTMALSIFAMPVFASEHVVIDVKYIGLEGKAESIRMTSVMGEPVASVLGRDIAYRKSITTFQPADKNKAAPATIKEDGTFFEGAVIEVSVWPTSSSEKADGKVIVRTSADFTRLLEMRELKVKGGSIQLPSAEAVNWKANTAVNWGAVQASNAGPYSVEVTVTRADN